MKTLQKTLLALVIVACGWSGLNAPAVRKAQTLDGPRCIPFVNCQ